MDYPEFKGRTAMITGGASGMGLLFGKKLAEAGANVVLCDVNRELLEAEAAAIRAQISLCRCQRVAAFSGQES
ncbi:MAG: SDR family NAD(P)-dependent oxidoreductase [Lentisphaeria bacterium]|nr:SDR family NAD(P)-dependent oxidoreductase [Lentisphaeria bacterium]